MVALTGWLALLCVPIALLSGAIVGWFYLPDPAGAHASLVELESAVAGGVYLRSLHALSSHAAMALGLLHFAAVLARREPRPRGLATGLWALALLGLLAFTGRALPWDQHGGMSLLMSERFLSVGGWQPVAALLGPLSAPLVLQRVWILHLGATLGLLALIAAHLPLLEKLRSLVAEAPRRRRATAAAALALTALLAGSALPCAHLGAPFVAEAEQSLGHSAEWYLRWMQLASLRAGSASLLLLVSLALLAVATPLLERARWRGLRVLWAGVLGGLLLLSLLPAS